MKEIVSKKPILVISIGALCSQIAREVLTAEKLSTPLLFGGVTSPRHLGIAPTTTAPHQTSGVSLGFVSYTQAADLLLYIKKDTKKVLIPYDLSADAGLLEIATQAVKAHFESNGVETVLLPFTKPETLFTQIEEAANGIDTIMNLEGCTSSTIHKDIIELCNRKEILFFTGTDIEIVNKGAALGFVPDPGLISDMLYDYVVKVVVEGVLPLDLPIKFLKNNGRRVIINLEAAKKQNLLISPELEYLLENGSMTPGSPPPSNEDIYWKVGS